MCCYFAFIFPALGRLAWFCRRPRMLPSGSLKNANRTHSPRLIISSTSTLCFINSLCAHTEKGVGSINRVISNGKETNNATRSTMVRLNTFCPFRLISLYSTRHHNLSIKRIDFFENKYTVCLYSFWRVRSPGATFGRLTTAPVHSTLVAMLLHDGFNS